MAEEKESRSREDLTEEASPHRLEEFRRKGIVAQSRELSGLLALIATGVAAYALCPKLSMQMSEFMKEVFRTDLSSRIDLGSPAVSRSYFMKGFHVMLSIGFPVCAAGFALGALGSVFQVGGIFSWDPLSPDFSKLDPIAGFKRWISIRQWIDGARLILKMIVVLVVVFFLVKTQVLSAPAHSGAEPGYLLTLYGKVAVSMFLSLVSVMAVFAALDFAYQRFEYMKNLKMTKQEAKQEHREREGDPQIRARIKAVQREMARRRMMQAVKKADVIVTNPTHIAVALSYKNSDESEKSPAKAKMSAPKVVAKGADFIAQQIKKVAQDAGIPMVENVPLARTLYKTVKVGQYIPRTLYQAVAEVLAYVYRLKKRNM